MELENYKIKFLPNTRKIVILKKNEEGFFFPIYNSDFMIAIEEFMFEELGRPMSRNELDQISEVF